MIFSSEQLLRYGRQIILSEVGGTGQERISNGKVLIVGAGGLGSPAALYLVAAGVGTIGIVDADVVDLSNLQRQIIHSMPDLDKPKVVSAKEKIEKVNSDVKVIAYHKHIYAENVMDIIKDYDFIIDGTDNFPAKFLINDACVIAAKAFSHGGILRFNAQTMTYTSGKACYRCVFPKLPPKDLVPTCSQAGVLGPVAGILGAIQATEALKYLIGNGDLLINRLLIFNALQMDFRVVKFMKNNACPLCGENPAITELKDYEQPTCSLKNK